ncbi:hypothetical protein BH11PSE6_BH11PSE6_26580 [soil metagenome]
MSAESVPRTISFYEIDPARVEIANEYEDGMFIAHRDPEGNLMGVVLEFDADEARATAAYLRAHGVVVARGEAAGL